MHFEQLQLFTVIAVYYCGTVTAVIAVLAYRVNNRNLRLSTVIYGYRGIPRYFAVFYIIQLLFNFFLCLSVIFIIFVGNFCWKLFQNRLLNYGCVRLLWLSRFTVIAVITVTAITATVTAITVMVTAITVNNRE